MRIRRGLRKHLNNGKKELMNEYDHFVFAPKGSLAGCDLDSSKAFNFTDKEEFPQGDKYIKTLDIEKFKDELEGKEAIIEDFIDTKKQYEEEVLEVALEIKSLELKMAMYTVAWQMIQ